MKTDLTAEELLSIYGGSGEGYTYIDGIDGTPLQGWAVVQLALGHGQPIVAFDGEIYRPVAVRFGDKAYDLPGDNPDHPGPY
jgi:hypothetical protein